MARAATTSDVYNAIAEPQRRAILELLCVRDRPVKELVGKLELGQPSVSKHLRVLREVDLVQVTKRGRERVYSANLEALQPVHQWVSRFESFWNHQLDAVALRAEAAHRKKQSNDG